MFRTQGIIPLKSDLIDPSGFNLKAVAGKPYRIFKPIFSEEQRQLYCLLNSDATYLHMQAVRSQAYDVIGDEYLFIRAYRVGHTLDLDLVLVVVEAQVRGGCHLIDDEGRIGGEGIGRWYGVLCPAEAQAELMADLKVEEARRRKSLRRALFRVVEDDSDEVDTSELDKTQSNFRYL
jgi:hypothetical protein